MQKMRGSGLVLEKGQKSPAKEALFDFSLANAYLLDLQEVCRAINNLSVVQGLKMPMVALGV